MIKKNRGFEIISNYKNNNINLPIRSTKFSAGYDFESAENIEIPSFFLDIKKKKIILIKTGIKAYMKKNEYLELINRSSNVIKRSLFLLNGVGIIDNDYYNNINNEGHIMFPFINFSIKKIFIKKGQKIGQGIFKKFLLTDDDNKFIIKKRNGGFGSTNF